MLVAEHVAQGLRRVLGRLAALIVPHLGQPVGRHANGDGAALRVAGCEQRHLDAGGQCVAARGQHRIGERTGPRLAPRVAREIALAVDQQTGDALFEELFDQAQRQGGLATARAAEEREVLGEFGVPQGDGRRAETPLRAGQEDAGGGRLRHRGQRVDGRAPTGRCSLVHGHRRSSRSGVREPVHPIQLEDPAHRRQAGEVVLLRQPFLEQRLPLIAGAEGVQRRHGAEVGVLDHHGAASDGRSRHDLALHRLGAGEFITPSEHEGRLVGPALDLRHMLRNLLSQPAELRGPVA